MSLAPVAVDVASVPPAAAHTANVKLGGPVAHRVAERSSRPRCNDMYRVDGSRSKSGGESFWSRSQSRILRADSPRPRRRAGLTKWRSFAEEKHDEQTLVIGAPWVAAGICGSPGGDRRRSFRRRADHAHRDHPRRVADLRGCV